MKTNLKKFIIVSTAILIFVFYFSFSNPVNSAAQGGEITGYAWNATSASSGMGWLSFGGTSPAYGVSINNTNGDVVGFAWSSNLGWLKFGGLSGFPTGSGTQSINANLNGTQLQGWARFCSVLSSIDCTGTTMKSSSETGGWDGWVGLSGAGYGVTVDQTTGAFSGHAWGGSDVVGWIDFSRVATTFDAPSLFLKANNNTGYVVIQIGNQANIKATGSMLNEATGVASGAWSGNQTCPSTLIPPGTDYGSFTHNTLGTFTYNLTCDKSDGSGKITSSVDVVVVENIAICPGDPSCVPTTKKPSYVEH
jgi:hypothetical protein